MADAIGDQWRIQDFPEEGALTPKGRGAPTYLLFGHLFPIDENEENLGQRGARVLPHKYKKSGSKSFTRWLAPSLLLTPSRSLSLPPHPSCSLRLRKLPRLPRLLRLAQGSEGFLRIQEGPRGPGRLRGQGGARESEGARGARPLSLTENARLPKAS